MNLYEKFVKTVYYDKCYWYRQGLIESKLSDDHYKSWRECIDCGGIDNNCTNYELDTDGSIDATLKEIDLNNIGVF